MSAKFRRVKRRKVEVQEGVEDPEGCSTSQLDIEQSLEASIEEDVCKHPGFISGLCYMCGLKVDVEKYDSVALTYVHQVISLHPLHWKLTGILTPIGFAGTGVGNEFNKKNKNKNKKGLCLLPHYPLPYLLLSLTNLTGTVICSLTAKDISRGSLFRLDFMNMLTKLRPFVRTFLEEANNMFEMYIYTMGERSYALQMASLLDPEKVYFRSGVIAKDDSTQKHQKGLDVVLGQESAVLILDDTESVWTKHKENLILMERYHFFASSCRQFGFNCKSLSELKSDETETEGALASVLKVLKQIHSMFFDSEPGADLADRDVRQVLKTVRRSVLNGCTVVFSRVFPTRFQAENHHLWKMAEQLGAICLTEADPSVTHVVSTDTGTEKSRWALQEKKFLVHPQWIEATNYFWQKQPEDKFPVSQPKSQ
ncbi:hypothetical protein C3L33_05490, partial [Rhododendron williamsianum]